MVSKLLLAVQEALLQAEEEGAEGPVRAGLRRHYRDIREGIGAHKAPDRYGAVPTDPYSHTPGYAGAQQPGMTGQVKEDLLARFGELGVRVREGRLGFGAELLEPAELLDRPGTFEYVDVGGEKRRLDLPSGSLAFTFCQVPVVIRRSGKRRLRLVTEDGGTEEIAGLWLDAERSASVFFRKGRIVRIEVDVVPGKG
jgi:hypothetical protein